MDGGFDGGGASVYSEAKGEYTKQLMLFIAPAFHRFFMTCLAQAATEEPQVKRQLWKFQELLSQIPDWNLDRVHREISKLVSEIQCDYLEELVTAVFIAHTKVLTAIRIGNKNKRVQITIPKLEHFLHRSLSECSRLLWTSAYLFHNELSPIEKQKNHRQIEQLIHEGISQAIRGLLPVKNILKDYLTETEDAEEDEKEDKEDKDDEDDEKEEKDVAAAAAAAEVAAVAATIIPTPPEFVEERHVEQLVDAPVVPVVVDQSINDAVVADTAADIANNGATNNAEEQEHSDAQNTVMTAPPTPIVVSEQLALQHQAPQQLQPPANPVVPTLIVDTEPSVRFTNFDQVIQEHGTGTSIGYVEKDRDADDDEENIEFLDEDGESLSEFEDLTAGVTEPLDMEDFETL
jgi:hypothetical protein